MSLNTVQLWLVATPLGNPDDLSPRAKDILERVDCVLAEDTRRTGLLFQRCAIQAKRLMSFHEHNEKEKISLLLQRLHGGETLAVVSDAGLPLIADPGYRLVRACRSEGIGVSVIPGPCAPVTALAGSGIAPQPFVFFGFLPRSLADIENILQPYATLPVSIIFFERKDRLSDSLRIARSILGVREVCVARELTKTHEEYLVGRLDDLPNIENLLGELTVVLGPPEQITQTTYERVLQLIAEEKKHGGSPRNQAKRVQARTVGWTVKAIYAMLSVETTQEREEGEEP